MPTEFEFIENLKNRFSLPKIGDDCAILPKDSKTDLVMTSDLLVEDIDFRLVWAKPEFIGHKSLAVSLSDVAAMGAKPVWSMVSLGVPEKIWKTDFVDEFYFGYMKLAELAKVELIGGDLSKTPDKIVIDSTVAGEVKKGRAIMRSGAKVGDLIFVTGNLGGAAAGLKLLENGEIFEHSEFKNFILQQVRPLPQLDAGLFLGENKLATSMIDLSDGLSGDLHHICQASGVGAKIYNDNIPFDKKLISITKSSEENLRLILNGGEDFELLFTADRKKNLHLQDLNFHRLGEITANVEIIELIDGLETKILEPKGFRHF